MVCLTKIDGNYHIMMTQEPLVKEPLYEKLKKRMMQDIERENCQMLPNEKELMARYGVSRNTLRRAILELTKENVLRPLQGIGTLVFPIPEIRENSRILLVCDRTMTEYQQEIFNELLFMLNNSSLCTDVMMIDKENVATDRFDAVLKNCDAVIIDQLCSFSQVIIEHTRRTGKKMICLRWTPNDPQVSFVTEDLRTGFYKLTRHLLDQGHREIAYLIAQEDIHRIAGISQALKDRGLEFDRKMLFDTGNGYRHDGYRIAGELLDSGRKFTAIMCNSDITALGVEERLLAAGKHILQEVAITGFDNIRDSAHFPIPLTTCGSRHHVMIQEAIGYLFHNDRGNEKLQKVIEPELIIRASTLKITGGLK